MGQPEQVVHHPAARILLVDSDASQRAVLSRLLADLPEVEVIEAADGAEALQHAHAGNFAMFVIALGLSGMDALELASILRLESPAVPAPIVFVSSKEPKHGEVLVEQARQFVQLHRKRQELQDMVHAANRQIRELQHRLDRFAHQHELGLAATTRHGMTGLPGRVVFEDRLRAALARAARASQRFALGYLDVHVLAVTRQYGQETTDALIRAGAERLVRAVRATDTVAHLDAGRFALLFENLDDLADGEPIARKVQQQLAAPFTLPVPGADAVALTVDSSLGLAIYPDHARSFDDLAVLADLTRQAAAHSGRGVLVYPGSDMNPRPRPSSWVE